MAYSTTDLSALGFKFNEKNETNYETSWLLCGKCHYWLTSPIFMQQDEKHYCAKCSTELGGGIRNKVLETFLQKAQFPCINEECPSWFSFENIQEHKGVCKFNVFACNLCTHQCTEKDYLDHLIGNHSGVCNKIKITNSSLKIEFKNNSESKENIIVGDYDFGSVVIHAKIENKHVYIGLASTQYDDTMKIETSQQYKFEDKCDGILGRTRLGKFMSLQQFGNLLLYDVVPLRQDFKFVGINITLENLGNSLKIADCPICMYPMKESIVLCENGHPVCNSCAPKMEKCAVCRMPMSRVTLRLSDVIHDIPKLEKMDVKADGSSKLAENSEEVESETLGGNSMTKCPECKVEMMVYDLLAHFIAQHEYSVAWDNEIDSSTFWEKKSENIYIIYGGHLFRFKFSLRGMRHILISVRILTSNDPIVARGYHYKMKTLHETQKNIQIEHMIEGPCQIESEDNRESVFSEVMPFYYHHNYYFFVYKL